MDNGTAYANIDAVYEDPAGPRSRRKLLGASPLGRSPQVDNHPDEFGRRYLVASGGCYFGGRDESIVSSIGRGGHRRGRGVGMRKLFTALLLNLIAVSVWAQQPQTQTAPIYAANSKYVQGVGPGYWPQAGAGLVLNLSAGRNRCVNTMVNYAGGTLTLANNTTNYVYLDTTASCVPTSNTSGYTTTGIAIATVVTSGGVITTITDDRVFGITTPASGTSGTITGSGTAGNCTRWTGTSTIANGTCLDDATHAIRSDTGYDVNSLGAYNFWVPNNASTGTVANKMTCDDGAGKAINCNHTTTTTNAPIGVAVTLNGAAPGTTGSTGECIIGFCSIVMDNSATANHFAQMSTSVDGDLSDVGATAPTNGLSYWYIFTGNSGAGTQAVIRNMLPSELNASSTSNNNGKGVQISVNGTALTKAIANFNATTPAAAANNQNITVQTSSSGNTSSISMEVPQATTGQAGLVQLAGDLAGTMASPTIASKYKIRGIPFSIGDPNGSALTVASTTTDYFTVPLACTISAYNLVILPSGTITVKFWKVATGTAAPTSGNSISTSGVGISSGNAIHSSTVSDFTTTAVAANDIMAMNVTAVATASYVSGVLECDQ